MSLSVELAETLADAGMRVAFTVPSIHSLSLLVALEGAGISLRPARSEVGAAHLADGHARVSGEPTGLITSTGPGSGNAVGAFTAAAKDGSPVVHISTTNFPGRQSVASVLGLHTVAEQSQWTALDAPVVDLGGNGLVAHVGELLVTRSPFSVLVPTSDDRAGGCVEPTAVANASSDDDATLEAALLRWLAVERRLLWIGGGARRVGTAGLVALAERTGAAVVTTVQAKDLFPADHPQLLGCTWNGPEVQAVAADADACLVLGSRLTEISTSVWAAPFPSIIIDVGRGPRGHLFPDTETVQVSADCSRAVGWIGSHVEGTPPVWGVEATAEAVRRKAARAGDPLASKLLRGVEAGLAPGDIVVADMTKLSFHALPGLRLPSGARFLFPGMLNMGFGLPAALGASVAAPGAHVVALVGDGSLLSMLPELDHAREWKGKVTVVLLDDNSYGLLESRVPDSIAAGTCRFPGPDWSVLARAFGFEARDVTADELGSALRLRSSGFAMLRVDVSGLSLDWRAS